MFLSPHTQVDKHKPVDEDTEVDKHTQMDKHTQVDRHTQLNEHKHYDFVKVGNRIDRYYRYRNFEFTITIAIGI